MSAFFKEVLHSAPADLASCAGLMLGQVAPVYHGVRLGVGEALLLRVAATASDTPVSELKAWKMARKGASVAAVWQHFMGYVLLGELWRELRN